MPHNNIMSLMDDPSSIYVEGASSLTLRKRELGGNSFSPTKGGGGGGLHLLFKGYFKVRHFS